jgi:hypothetical protein
MAGLRQIFDPAGQHGHAVFVTFDLSGQADEHCEFQSDRGNEVCLKCRCRVNSTQRVMNGKLGGKVGLEPISLSCQTDAAVGVGMTQFSSEVFTCLVGGNQG